MDSYIGIDISKESFMAAFKIGSKMKVMNFINSTDGFDNLLNTLKANDHFQNHFCMEATGKYGIALAEYLYEKGHKVSVVNPAKICFFAKSQLIRNKNDIVDSKVILQYCEIFKPALWEPTPIEIKKLDALVKRADTLRNTMLQENNRFLEADSFTKNSIEEHMDYLESKILIIEQEILDHIKEYPSLAKQKSLLDSIPGLGHKSVPKIIVALGDIKKFKNAKEVAAFIGLNPLQKQSGTSMNYCKISKIGSPELRKMLYMPSLTAIRYNPILKDFYNKLVDAGKPKKVALCAVMRKFWHIIYGVLKTNTPFNADISKDKVAV